jgi:hypothetical protein
LSGGDPEEVPVELFVVLEEAPQGALAARKVGPSEAYGVQAEAPQGALLGREAGLLEVFVGPEVTEP